MRIVCVAGARPNFMKIKPVIDALDAGGAETVLVHTGQHFDPGMSDVFFDELGLRTPDHHLGAGAGTHAEQTGRVLVGMEALLTEVKADAVVVVGDVNSTVAAALAAAKAGCLVAHVEAGLRSRDWDMPEEVNRVVTDRVSDYLFAPSPDAVANLEREGYRPDQIHLVGNVMIDTLLVNLPRARQRSTLADFGVTAGGYGLVTLHRPANVDDATVLAEVMDALGDVAADCAARLSGAPAHARRPLHPHGAAGRHDYGSARIPRLHRARSVGGHRAHRFGWHPGRDHRPRRALLDAA